MAKKTKKKVVKKEVVKEPKVAPAPVAEKKVETPANPVIPPARNLPPEVENHPVCPHCMNEIFELKWAVYGDGKIKVIYCKHCLRALGAS